MATIKDVAKAAGVSHGTVSNVLNGKSGVASDKVAKVLEAVKALGYVPDQTAKHLKTASSKSIAVVLPNITDPHYSRIFTGAERVLSERGYAPALHITGEIPAKEREILSEIHRNRAAGCILATCMPEDGRQVARMEEAGIQFVFVERERAGRSGTFVECDGAELIAAATADYFDRGIRDIVLLVGPREYSSEGRCIEAFVECLSSRGAPPPDRFIRITNYDRESAFREAMAVFEGADIPQAVITSSGLLMEGVQSAYALTKSLFPIRPEFAALAEDSWTVEPPDGMRRLRRSSVKLGERAAELLLDLLESEGFPAPRRERVAGLTSRRLGFGDGRRASDPVRAASGEPLRVLMLEGAHAQALSALLPDFMARTGCDVEIMTRSYERLYDATVEACRDGGADVVQIDIPWMPELARRGAFADLTPLVGDDPQTTEDFIPGILDAYARVDGRILAFPYLFGTQLLFYRKDLFEDEGIRHRYRARFKTELRPPESWPEFNAVASFFTRSCSPDSPVAYGTTLGARVSSGAVCEFLPRLWGYGGDIFDPAGKVVLDSPESAWALAEYAKSFRYASPESADNWWDEQVEEFSRGDAAMMILFVAHATRLTDRRSSAVVGRIGYAAVPGGVGLLGGWSLGVAASSPRKEGAFEFLSWATGPELAIPATVLGGTTPSIGLYKSSELLSVYPWLPKALDCFSSSRKRTLPGRYLEAGFSERDLEEIIGSLVHRCVTGEAGPEEVLRSAAERLRSAI